MKRLLLFLVATIGVFVSAAAQDVIVLKNADEIQAKVRQIGENEITYQKWNNLDGPAYTFAKSDVLFIRYENGIKESFVTQTVRSKSARRVALKDASASKFSGYCTAGVSSYSMGVGPTIDLSFGSRMSEYFYLGGGLDFSCLFQKKNSIICRFG